jgi:hypothetical protein
MNARAGDPLGALTIGTGAGTRLVWLVDYLDGASEEASAAAAHEWIKAVRRLEVDGEPFRRRFHFRGDSLWWFGELYLHKQQIVLNVFRTIAALEKLIELQRPETMSQAAASRLLGIIGPQVAGAAKIPWVKSTRQTPWQVGLLAMDLRARFLMLGSKASRLRRRPTPAPPHSYRPLIAAFVHNAFWRAGSADGSAESYIGPVLEALEASETAGVRYIGVGPASNFRARRWWHALKPADPSRSVTSIESFAAPGSMKPSRRLWRDRHAHRRALWGSVDLQRHAVIRGCDCWEIVREELAGIALLQWPWSARAMDEAAAALDMLRPAVVLTYAEAGGWGRALVLESRRRRIPSVGLQHGFIYRHWLNYRHEADEMAPDPSRPHDTGFPKPTLTLLFDEYTREHLQTQGSFPSRSLDVTGSPRLDALVAGAAAIGAEDIERVRATAGAGGDRLLVVVVTKYREATGVLGPLAEAVRSMPDVQLAIKPHPAETPDVYAGVAAMAANIRVLPADAPLAPLLAASRAVVTVNSTVAIDAAVLGVPALVVGLPNNLSPFVDAGLMLGTGQGEPIGPALHRILYDEGFRLQLERDRGTYLARFGIGSDGRAAARAAGAVLALTTRDGQRGRPDTA